MIGGSGYNAESGRPEVRTIDNMELIEAADARAQRGRWYKWAGTSKTTSRSLVRPRYYLTAVGIVVILSIFLLYQHQGDDLGQKINSPFHLGRPSPPAEPLEPAQPPRLPPVGVGIQHGPTNTSESVYHKAPPVAS